MVGAVRSERRACALVGGYPATTTNTQRCPVAQQLGVQIIDIAHRPPPGGLSHDSTLLRPKVPGIKFNGNTELVP